MNNYFGYTRVSTVKQGERGVSLQEQRAAIESYAARSNLKVSQWFEERETAAKRGRPVFDRMMVLLKAARASGVIIHKIDRSARNLRDWSDLGEMMDGGIEVHFANEALDLNSRGGRLSADIQAVVAADFIRNLRDETKKGMRGRYRQGLFPLPAPIGYLDRGSGQPKAIDPVQGPLVRRMFELYASGIYGQIELGNLMYELGLRTKRGNRVDKSTVSWMLANPFYYGMIRLKATGEMFEGRHQALISQTLFRAGRTVSAERFGKRVAKHNFVYRRSLRCGGCGYNLTGEKVKQIVYYRCHTRACAQTSIRDDQLSYTVLDSLAALEMQDDEKRYMFGLLDEISAASKEQRADMVHAAQASLDSVKVRLSRLTDAYLDAVLDRNVLLEKQKALLGERKEIEERLHALQARHDVMREKLSEFLDFAASVKSVFVAASPTVKQQLLRRVALRVTVTDREASIALHKPYELFASRGEFGSPTANGEYGPEAPTSNGWKDENGAAHIAQGGAEDAIASSKGCIGCPLPGGLPTRTKGLLKDIGLLLLTDESLTIC